MKANEDGPRGAEPGLRRGASAARTRGCRDERRAGERRGHGAAPHRERRGCARRRGRSEGVPGGFPPRQPAGRRPTSRSSSPHLGVGRERRAMAGRRVCFQPRLLTWRPKSCHRVGSGLPPLRWRRHLLPCRPASFCAPFPAGGLAAGGSRPRSIERKRLERTHRWADNHRVPVQTQPGWSVSLLVRPLTVLGRLAWTETEVREMTRGGAGSHAQFGVSSSAGLVGWLEGVTRGVLCTELAGDVTVSGDAGTDLRGRRCRSRWRGCLRGWRSQPWSVLVAFACWGRER